MIPSFSWIAPPRPPPWRNPRKGRDQILPTGNLAAFTAAAASSDSTEIPTGPAARPRLCLLVRSTLSTSLPHFVSRSGEHILSTAYND